MDFQDLLVTLIALGTVAVIGGMVSLLLWFVVLGGRGRLLPLQRLRPGSWQGREVALVFLVMIFIPGMAQGFLEGIGFYQEFYGKEPTSEQKQLWYMALAFPIIVAGSFLILFTLSGTRPRHLGMTTGRWAQNIILGWLTWFPLTILTLGMYYLVRFWIKAREHSLGRALDSQAIAPEWLLGIFLAVVIAPFLEELVFRGVLQGWLRRCSVLGHAIVAGATLFLGSISLVVNLLSKQKTAEVDFGPTLFALILIAGYLGLVRRVWRQRSVEFSQHVLELASVRQAGPVPETTDAIREGSPPLPAGESADRFTTALPVTSPGQVDNTKNIREASILTSIYGSAMLFAVFHSSVWPTPIPLFVLGLGLGWLAYRTHSLVGSITVHVLFNSVACLVLGLSVFYGKENGKAETNAFRPSAVGSSSTMVPGSWCPRFK